MTQANLQTLWASYQSHKQVYCLHSSVRSVHNSRKKKHLSSLMQPSSVSEFDKVCTQFEGKTSHILIRLTKAQFRKNQPYTYLTYKSWPSCFAYCDSYAFPKIVRNSSMMTNVRSHRNFFFKLT